MSKSNGKLRFASLIRVSTEKQQAKGESLRTQAKQIEHAVASMGGVIATTYAGQEHGTPGWERKQLEKLLQDAAKKPKRFDAVIVTDPSRWSRDNVQNETGLDHLRDHGIRFFVLGMEFDLFDPFHRHILSSQAGVNKLQAALQKQKSLLNRIERARRGIPTGGKLPFGRTFNKQTEKWGTDDTKKELIDEVARRYLAGESMEKLAYEKGMNHQSLHKTVMQRSGTKWHVKFNAPDLNIRETVEMTIPSLLDDETIRKCRDRAKANLTYAHGQRGKNRYLLASMVFCERCGRTLTGQPGPRGEAYYRHLVKPHIKKCESKIGQVRADELEHAVMLHLFDCFGNPAGLEKAVQAAFPNQQRISKVRERIAELGRQRERIKQERAKVLNRNERGLIPDDEADERLTRLRETDFRLAEELERLGESIENVPSLETVKETAAKVVEQFKPKPKQRKIAGARKAAAINSADTDFNAMTWEEKRQLTEMVFSGKTLTGKRMGVYVRPAQGDNARSHRKWEFTIHGHFIQESGRTGPDVTEDSFAFSTDGYPTGQRRLLKRMKKRAVTTSLCH